MLLHQIFGFIRRVRHASKESWSCRCVGLIWHSRVKQSIIVLHARRIQRRNVWLWIQPVPSVRNIVRNSSEPCACPFIRFPKTGTRRRRGGTRLNIPVRWEFSRDLISGLKRVPPRNWYGANRASEESLKDQNGGHSLALHPCLFLLVMCQYLLRGLLQ